MIKALATHLLAIILIVTCDGDPQLCAICRPRLWFIAPTDAVGGKQPFLLEPN